MEMGCGASGAAATDLPAATFLDGVFTNAFGGHCGAGMDGASGAAATDLLAAMFFDGPFRLNDFKGHGRAASVLGDAGSAFSRSNWLIHDSFANSLHHFIHACAHSHLDRCGVGFGVCGVGVACPLLLSLLCVSRVDDDVDDACMDGSNSLIQGSGCHATACACSDALQNSRQACGHCLRGGTKCTSMGAKVWLSDEIRGSLSHQKPESLHVEMWAGAQECLPQEGFQVRELPAGCASVSFPACCSDLTSVLPGPGSEIRKQLGWIQLEKTDRSGVWFFRGAFQGEDLFLPLPFVETGLKRCRTAQRGRSLGIPCARAHMRMGMAQLSGHTRESGVGYCSRGCGGLSLP